MRFLLKTALYLTLALSVGVVVGFTWSPANAGPATCAVELCKTDCDPACQPDQCCYFNTEACTGAAQYIHQSLCAAEGTNCGSYCATEEPTCVFSCVPY